MSVLRAAPGAALTLLLAILSLLALASGAALGFAAVVVGGAFEHGLARGRAAGEALGLK